MTGEWHRGEDSGGRDKLTDVRTAAGPLLAGIAERLLPARHSMTGGSGVSDNEVGHGRGRIAGTRHVVAPSAAVAQTAGNDCTEVAVPVTTVLDGVLGTYHVSGWLCLAPNNVDDAKQALVPGATYSSVY